MVVGPWNVPEVAVRYTAPLFAYPSQLFFSQTELNDINLTWHTQFEYAYQSNSIWNLQLNEASSSS